MAEALTIQQHWTTLRRTFTNAANGKAIHVIMTHVTYIAESTFEDVPCTEIGLVCGGRAFVTESHEDVALLPVRRPGGHRSKTPSEAQANVAIQQQTGEQANED